MNTTADRDARCDRTVACTGTLGRAGRRQCSRRAKWEVIGPDGRAKFCHSHLAWRTGDTVREFGKTARLEADAPDRLPFVQAPRWRTGKDADGDPYANDRCCYCYRPTAPDAARLWLTRDNSGEWYVVAPDAPVREDERQLGDPHFTLPVGPDCLRRHPEWAFAADRAARST